MGGQGVGIHADDRNDHTYDSRMFLVEYGGFKTVNNKINIAIRLDNMGDTNKKRGIPLRLLHL